MSNRMYCNHCREFIQYIGEHNNGCPERIHTITSTDNSSIGDKMSYHNYEMKIGDLKDQIAELEKELRELGPSSMLKVFRENKSSLDECREENRKLREVVEFCAVSDKGMKNFWARATKRTILNGLLETGKRARQLLDQLNKDKK